MKTETLTQRKWVADKNHIVDAKYTGSIICSFNLMRSKKYEEDLNYTVKAVNSHEALLSALKRFMIVYNRKSNIDKLGWNSLYSDVKAIIDKIEK